MLYIDNIRIYKVDEYNYSYDYLGYVEKKTGEMVLEWKQSRKYFGNLKQCLDSIKEKLLRDKLDVKTKDLSVDEYIKEIEKLNGAYVNCELVCKEIIL